MTVADARFSPVDIVEADLSREDHARAVRELIAAYAADEMGAGHQLPAETLDRLVPALRALPTSVVLLAFVEAVPVGIATCFVSLSTFAARPLINVHDLAVTPDHRGRGIGRRLLEAVERKARTLGCVKITLEVGDRNTRAESLYRSVGFEHASAGPGAGSTLFYVKPL